MSYPPEPPPGYPYGRRPRQPQQPYGPQAPQQPGYGFPQAPQQPGYDSPPPPQRPVYGSPQVPQRPVYASPQAPQAPQALEPVYELPEQPTGGWQLPVQSGYPRQRGFNYPNAPRSMPGSVHAARVIMFVFGGFGVLGAIGTFYQASQGGGGKDGASGPAAIDPAIMAAAGVASLVLAATAILLASRFNRGGNGVRIGAIAFGAVIAILGLLTVIVVVGIVPLGIGLLIIIFMVKQEGSDWFKRKYS
ncbi:hypothetical protein G4Z16_11575 [Streptomyces bathyalis]|uniref:Uncharacterized protein n=1 Tax=Streptomyces bathyalis TaxID=2710756 RepID=A0A7T1T5R4_9ACTN|nr:hypothetical protein [Streptomyces bathyalis]QPP06919.1 hypothetical protein G4Z16_11575 [Streptomyces bathyalis]